MKVVISYLQSIQVAPNAWDVHTEIIHINEHDTLLDVYEKHFKKGWTGDVNVELHFNIDNVGV